MMGKKSNKQISVGSNCEWTLIYGWQLSSTDLGLQCGVHGRFAAMREINDYLKNEIHQNTSCLFPRIHLGHGTTEARINYPNHELISL